MSANNVLKQMKDKDIEYVDLRFTDPRGKLQHVTMDSKVVDEEMLEEGIFFDGSSIAGWKAINESDMILKIHLSYLEHYQQVVLENNHLLRPVCDPCFHYHNLFRCYMDLLSYQF